MVATTAEDGTYSLKVYPGMYEVTIASDGYVTQTTGLNVAVGDEITLDAALLAGIPTVEPIELTVEARVRGRSGRRGRGPR